MTPHGKIGRDSHFGVGARAPGRRGSRVGGVATQRRPGLLTLWPSAGVTTRPGRLAGRPRPLGSAGSPPSGGTPPVGAQVATGPQPRPPAEPPPPAPAPALLPCGRSGVGAARSLSAPPCTRPVSPSVASLTWRWTLPSSDPLPVAPVPSSTSSMPRTKHRPGNSARYRDHPRSSCEVQFPGTSLSLIILPVLTPSVFLLIGATHHQAPSGN